MTKSKQRLIKCAICAVFAAAICALSPFAIPAAVPITLATFGVYVAAGCLTPGMSAAAVALYLAIGALGVPVFSGFTGGIGKLAGPTGGYLVGYLPMAAVTSALIAIWRRARRGKKTPAALDAAVYAFSMVAATAVLYALGTAWFVIQQKTTLAAALPLCVFPFLPGDTAKILAAAIISRALAPIVDRAIGRK